jgi:hypothetical protein
MPYNLEELKDCLITDYSTLKKNHAYLVVIYDDQYQVPVKLVDGRDNTREKSVEPSYTFNHLLADEFGNFAGERPDIPHQFSFPMEIFVGDLYNSDYDDEDAYKIRIYDLQKIDEKIRYTIYEETPLTEDVINEIREFEYPANFLLPRVHSIRARKIKKNKKTARGGRRTNKKLRKSNRRNKNKNTKRQNKHK